MCQVTAASAPPSICCARLKANLLSIVVVSIIGIALTVFLRFYEIDSKSVKIIIAVYLGGCVALPAALICLWPQMKACCHHEQWARAEDFVQNTGFFQLHCFALNLESGRSFVRRSDRVAEIEKFCRLQVQALKEGIASFKKRLLDPIDNQLLKECFQRAGKSDEFTQLKNWVEDPDSQLKPFQEFCQKRIEELSKTQH